MPLICLLLPLKRANKTNFLILLAFAIKSHNLFWICFFLCSSWKFWFLLLIYLFLDFTCWQQQDIKSLIKKNWIFHTTQSTKLSYIIIFAILFNFPFRLSARPIHKMRVYFFPNQTELYLVFLKVEFLFVLLCIRYILCKKSFHIKWCNSNTWQHVYAFICQDAMTFCVYWSEFESKNKK